MIDRVYAYMVIRNIILRRSRMRTCLLMREAFFSILSFLNLTCALLPHNYVCTPQNINTQESRIKKHPPPAHPFLTHPSTVLLPLLTASSTLLLPSTTVFSVTLHASSAASLTFK